MKGMVCRGADARTHCGHLLRSIPHTTSLLAGYIYMRSMAIRLSGLEKLSRKSSTFPPFLASASHLFQQLVVESNPSARFPAESGRTMLKILQNASAHGFLPKPVRRSPLSMLNFQQTFPTYSTNRPITPCIVECKAHMQSIMVITFVKAETDTSKA